MSTREEVCSLVHHGHNMIECLLHRFVRKWLPKSKQSSMLRLRDSNWREIFASISGSNTHAVPQFIMWHACWVFLFAWPYDGATIMKAHGMHVWLWKLWLGKGARTLRTIWCTARSSQVRTHNQSIYTTYAFDCWPHSHYVLHYYI